MPTEYVKFQLRSDTRANFAAVTLLAGEPAICTDTGELLIGDGVTAGASLTAYNAPDFIKAFMARRLAKSAAYTVVAADRGAMIDATTGTWTLTLTASATLGAGFAFAVFNSGTGTITIDADGTETILDVDGAEQTKELSEGWAGLLFTNGSNWRMMKFQPGGGTGGGSLVIPETWTAVAPPESNTWRSVAFGNGTFVACSSDGTNRVMYTNDGRVWKAVSVSSKVWRWITFANGRFYMVSEGDGTTSWIGISPDGINWEYVAMGTNQGFDRIFWLRGILYCTIYSTTDHYYSVDGGYTWTLNNFTFANGFAMTFANGKFVNIGQSGAFSQRVDYSNDGTTWGNYNAGPSSNSWRGIAYGFGKFVVVSASGSSDRMAYSADAISWTSVAAPNSAGANGYSFITYGGGGVFFCAHDIGGPSGTDGAYSLNGVSWTAVTVPAGSWACAAFGNGIWIMVGNGTNKTAYSGDATGYDPTQWRTRMVDDKLESFSADLSIAWYHDEKTLYHPSADTTARTVTIPANSSVPLQKGFSFYIINDNSAGALTLAITTDTLVWGGAGAGATGSRTIAANGWARVQKVTSTRWQVVGEGIT